MELTVLWRYGVLCGISILIRLTASEEYVNEEQSGEYAQYPAASHDPIYDKLLNEGRKKWPQAAMPSQPLNIGAELQRLNESHTVQLTWPTSSRALGVVSAVSFDNANNVVVFHRSDHVWNQNTFDERNRYQPSPNQPIRDNTIIAFDRITGNVTYEWGNDMFFMPHGLLIDHEDNTWVTDVALHQVMRFGPKNRTHPELVLGARFQPGKKDKFCKPTAVAVLPEGDFFVADGYCNSRILKYSKAGEVILSWGTSSFTGIAFDVAPENFFAVPHALTLAADQGLLCVADRENGRVQCFYTKEGKFHSQYHSPIVGDRLFSVAYAPINGGQLYVVNGPQLRNDGGEHIVGGFVIEMKTKNVIAKFGRMENPHDIIVSPDGREIYVAQLFPNKVLKYVTSDLASLSINMTQRGISSKPLVTLDNQDATKNDTSLTNSNGSNSTQTLIVVGLFLSFMAGTLAIILTISRRRKLGCLPHDTRNRRHAWDFPTVKTDGFKLGNLLERKQGFVKLDQEASDEEAQPTANMLPTTDASYA